MLLLVAATWSGAFAADVSLDGEWFFAIDPLRKGEEHRWNQAPEGWSGSAPLRLDGWDRVVTPHDYLSDPRYEWTGVAWYRRSFSISPLKPDEVCRLRFDRVASNCEVWVNGQHAGSHHGGYSAFEFDITPLLQPGLEQHIAVKVDNSWQIGDIPGPRMGDIPSHQMYVWRNYGGILRSARLLVNSAVYVTKQKIETIDSSPGGVDIKTKVFVRNASASARVATVSAEIGPWSEQEAQTPLALAGPVEVSIPAGGTAKVELTTNLAATGVQYWSVGSPSLYYCRAQVTSSGNDAVDQHVDTFGIRNLQVSSGKLLLNEIPVRIAGANRVEGHPRFGGLEPAELIDQDLRMMKLAHLECQRLQHYPPSEEMLDWADRHGMLVIAEAPCWGLTSPELSDERYRENFCRQLTEMIEAAWNHPSVIGWSVGNEYHAWTPAGMTWTKDYVALAHQLDPTRPTTYAALGYDISQAVAEKESRGMHWVDFISVNLYSSGVGSGAALDKIHALWPEKPILISEYGKRTDQDTEAARIRHFRDMLQQVRARDFVMGLSYWSFNDYRSRYPGGDETGHRPWGIVTADRTPRELYSAMQSELSPAVLTILQRSPLWVRIEARHDFPSLPLDGQVLQILTDQGSVFDEVAIPKLLPGQRHDVAFGTVAASGICLKDAAGFLTAELDLPHETDSTKDPAE